MVDSKFQVPNNRYHINVDHVIKFIRRSNYYFKIWVLMSKNAFIMIASQKMVLVIFLLGKVLRFSFFVSFLYFLVQGAGNLAGYTTNQTIFFFLTFMVIDTTSQFLFREVYKFRQLIVSGDFDLVLLKPANSLFRVLMGGIDIIDFITLPPLYLATVYVGNLLNPSLMQFVLYFLLILSGLLISTAFHIAVLAIGIISLEVDHTIMIYRDISAMGRFPIDIYQKPLKTVLTYFLPIGIMVSLPSKAIFGLVSIDGLILSFSFSFVFMFIALKFWKFALTKYTSASS